MQVPWVWFLLALKIQTESRHSGWGSSSHAPVSIGERGKQRSLFICPFFFSFKSLESVSVAVCARCWEQVPAQPGAILSPHSLYCVRIEEYSWNGYLLSSRLMKQHMVLWVLAPKLPLQHPAPASFHQRCLCILNSPRLRFELSTDAVTLSSFIRGVLLNYIPFVKGSADRCRRRDARVKRRSS